MEDKIANYAGDILDHLSEILPDVEDEGALGELVLMKALETYRFVVENGDINEKEN
jgi:hypothetical protein